MTAASPFAQRQTIGAARPRMPIVHHPEPTIDPRAFTMPQVATTSTNSAGWITFTYIQFGCAVFMAGLGLFFLPVDLQTKGYLLMSYVFALGATFTLAKTIRDEHEAKKLTTRIEDARTEKLLMEVGR